MGWFGSVFLFIGSIRCVHLLPSLRAAAGGLLRRRGCRFPPSGPHLPSLHLQYQSISLPPHAAGFCSRGHLPAPHPPPHLTKNPNVTPRPAPRVDLSPWLRLLKVFVGERIGRCLGSFQGEGGGAQCGSIRIGLRGDLARVVRCLGESRLVDSSAEAPSSSTTAVILATGYHSNVPQWLKVRHDY